MDILQNFNKRAVLLVTTLSSFVTPFMVSSGNVALPSIGKVFAMNAVLLSWVNTSYLLAFTMFIVPFGRIADIYGRKKIFLYGFVIYTLSAFLCAIATSPFFLISSRILQGIGASMISSTVVAIVTSVFPPGDRGKALGLYVAGVYSGLSSGPYLGGLLVHYFSWRAIFLVNIPIGVLIVTLTFLKLKEEWMEAKGEKFDFIGSILYSFTLAAIIYGFTILPGTWGAFLILLGLLGVWAFVKWEINSESPVFDLRLFKNNKIFAFSNLAALIHYSASSTISFLLSLYLQFIKGLHPHEAGLVLISQPIVQAFLSPFAGRLSDRIEPRIVASIGMALTAVGLSFFIFLDENTTISFIIFTLMFMGLGFALFSSPNMNAVMGSIEKKYYGVASGTLGTTRTTGMTFSMGVVMLLFSIYIGQTSISPPNYPLFIKSVQTAFIIYTVLCLAGIFASLSRGRAR